MQTTEGEEMGLATEFAAQIPQLTAPREQRRDELERPRPALNADGEGKVREVTQPAQIASEGSTRTWD
jgi:hypothetical protein